MTDVNKEATDSRSDTKKCRGVSPSNHPHKGEREYQFTSVLSEYEEGSLLSLAEGLFRTIFSRAPCPHSTPIFVVATSSASHGLQVTAQCASSSCCHDAHPCAVPKEQDLNPPGSYHETSIYPTIGRFSLMNTLVATCRP